MNGIRSNHAGVYGDVVLWCCKAWAFVLFLSLLFYVCALDDGLLAPLCRMLSSRWALFALLSIYLCLL